MRENVGSKTVLRAMRMTSHELTTCKIIPIGGMLALVDETVT